MTWQALYIYVYYEPAQNILHLLFIILILFYNNVLNIGKWKGNIYL